MGIIPDRNRGSAFAAVFLMCALQVVAKAAAMALLAVTNGTLLLGYVAVDHGLHFLFKVAQSDWVYVRAKRAQTAARVPKKTSCSRNGLQGG
jgi:hypothetical protein